MSTGENRWSRTRADRRRKQVSEPSRSRVSWPMHFGVTERDRPIGVSAFWSAWLDEWDLVVDRGDRGPWVPPTFSRAWTAFARKAGLPVVGFHELRHGAATLMLAAGIPDAVAIKMMGHRDTRILRRYQKVVDRLKQEAAERLDELLGGWWGLRGKRGRPSGSPSRQHLSREDLSEVRIPTDHQFIDDRSRPLLSRRVSAAMSCGDDSA